MLSYKVAEDHVTCSLECTHFPTGRAEIENCQRWRRLQTHEVLPLQW